MKMLKNLAIVAILVGSQYLIAMEEGEENASQFEQNLQERALSLSPSSKREQKEQDLDMSEAGTLARSGRSGSSVDIHELIRDLDFSEALANLRAENMGAKTEQQKLANLVTFLGPIGSALNRYKQMGGTWVMPKQTAKQLYGIITTAINEYEMWERESYLAKNISITPANTQERFIAAQLSLGHLKMAKKRLETDYGTVLYGIY